MNLHEYLELLEQQDEIQRISTAVNCDLEVAALSRLEFRRPEGGRVLLFEKLEKSQMSLVTNLFGSQKRLLKMLRCGSLEDLAEKYRSILQMRKDLRHSDQPVETNQTELALLNRVRLSELPSIRSWPGEKGSYLTLALTVTADPMSGNANLGLYRAQVLGEQQIALNFAPGSGAGRHLQIAKQLNRPLPVALFLGSDPAYLCAAATPLPDGWSEFDFSVTAFGTRNRLISCQSHDLLVPADAEMVIEGFIDPAACCQEGPFGNHTGQYVTRTDCPLLQVVAVQQKPQPVVPMTVVGPPPSENVQLGRVNEIFVRETLKLAYPQIVDLQMPQLTMFHGVSLLTVCRSSRQANQQLIRELWHNSPLKGAKLMVLLDDDVALENAGQCWWRAVNLLESKRIYQDKGRIAIDATGVNISNLVTEDPRIIKQLLRRLNEDNV